MPIQLIALMTIEEMTDIRTAPYTDMSTVGVKLTDLYFLFISLQNRAVLHSSLD
jgi:hypothetical protein